MVDNERKTVELSEGGTVEVVSVSDCVLVGTSVLLLDITGTGPSVTVTGCVVVTGLNGVLVGSSVLILEATDSVVLVSVAG